MRKKRILLPVIIMVVLLLTACGSGSSDTSDANKDEAKASEMVENETKAPEEPGHTWKDDFSELLVTEISVAFTEIGENPDYIESIQYKDEQQTDLFVRRNYVVTFIDNRVKLSEVFDSDKMGWAHHPAYLITTEEWNEGEPERAQYPEEYLVTMKFWDGKDITTNINQWTHTGGGKLQEK